MFSSIAHSFLHFNCSSGHLLIFTGLWLLVWDFSLISISVWDTPAHTLGQRPFFHKVSVLTRSLYYLFQPLTFLCCSRGGIYRWIYMTRETLKRCDEISFDTLTPSTRPRETSENIRVTFDPWPWTQRHPHLQLNQSEEQTVCSYLQFQLRLLFTYVSLNKGLKHWQHLCYLK